MIPFGAYVKKLFFLWLFNFSLTTEVNYDAEDEKCQSEEG